MVFKVIIIGGGPAGLSLAHACHLADIDYTLYDRRLSLEEPHGAAFAVQPQNVRLLQQFGVLDAATSLAPLMKKHRALGVHGEELVVVSELDFFEWLYENHGYHFLLFERWELLRLLYQTLPDRQARVKTGLSLQGIEVSDHGVRAYFDDGSMDEGSIVVGADGTRSTTRNIMQALSHGRLSRDNYSAPFRALFGIGPLLDGMEPGIVSEISYQGFWFQIISQPGRLFWNLYLARPDSADADVRYSDAEAEAVALEFKDFQVGGGYVLGDLWRTKWRAKLSPLEEGVMQHWHWNRIVLIGDAAHKVTPNLAYGGNMGFEGSASLVNLLHALLKQNSDPETKSLTRVFEKYQSQRKPLATWYWKATRFNLRSQAALTPWLRFQSRLITLFYSPRWIVDHKVSILMAEAPKLDFVRSESQPPGKVPFVDEAAPSETSHVLLRWRRLRDAAVGMLLPF